MTDKQQDNPSPKIEPGRGAGAELTDTIQHERARDAPLAGTIRADETAAPESGTWKIEQGADVTCRDGDKIGEVVDVRPGYLVVEEGFFDPRDLYVPLDLVASHDETCLTLSITREAFDRGDWTVEPPS